MATKGRTTAGASGRTIANRPYAREETFDAGDQITSLEMWLTIASASRDVQAAIWDTSGNRVALGTAVATGVGLVNPSSPISYTIPSTGTYAIGYTVAAGADSEDGMYDATGAVSHYDADASEGHPPPATWAGFVADAGTDNNSIAVTYTPAASGDKTPYSQTHQAQPRLAQ